MNVLWEYICVSKLALTHLAATFVAVKLAIMKMVLTVLVRTCHCSNQKRVMHSCIQCELGLDDCDDPRVADCINNPGNFSCTCKTGYTGSGRNGTCAGE